MSAILAAVIDDSSDTSRRAAPRPNDLRAISLDATDRRMIAALQADARLPNNALAAALGIAPSTCHARMRRLVSAGVIRGFFADVDPVAVGRPLRALIAVSLQPDARGRIRWFVADIGASDQVIDVFFLAGADDFLLHVAVADSDALRGYVEGLNARDEVAGTTTSLVFEHVRGAPPVF